LKTDVWRNHEESGDFFSLEFLSRKGEHGGGLSDSHFKEERDFITVIKVLNSFLLMTIKARPTTGTRNSNHLPTACDGVWPYTCSF